MSAASAEGAEVIMSRLDKGITSSRMLSNGNSASVDLRLNLKQKNRKMTENSNASQNLKPILFG